jgi:crotonobetainyl-CoA:carnitine CoA-transferase CaiB-like acyl-CoA transferase
MTGEGLLAGVRVVDFGWVWSGPMVSATLADLGADVIKIEHRGRLDNARLRGRPAAAPADAPSEEVSPYFHQNNRGKRSVCLDIKHPDGQLLARRLLDESDILVENLSVGALARAGLGWEPLSRRNPGLIYLSMASAGQDGPLSSMRAYAPVMSAMSGAESLVGYHDDPVVGMMTVAIGDPNAASHALVAVLAALVARETTGQGQFIDMSQIDAMTCVLGEAIAEVQLGGADPSSRGLSHRTFAPHGHYPCAGDDRWIALAARDDDEWARMADALGSPRLASDERFREARSRRAHAGELDVAIADRTIVLDRDTLFARLQQARVTAAPVLAVEEARTTVAVREGGLFQSVVHPVSGVGELSRTPWRMSSGGPRVRRAAPTIGEHTHEVMSSVLGLTPEEIERYEENGALR